MYIQKDLIEKGAEFPNSEIKLLSPFDNSLIHRDRFKQLFNFDFRLECYLPKEKKAIWLFLFTHFVRKYIYWQGRLQST